MNGSYSNKKHEEILGTNAFISPYENRNMFISSLEDTKRKTAHLKREAILSKQKHICAERKSPVRLKITQ